MESNKPRRQINVARIVYFADLLVEKMDLSTKIFMQRVAALRARKPEEAEFIEEMSLKQIDKQVSYLAGKLHETCERELQIHAE